MIAPLLAWALTNGGAAPVDVRALLDRRAGCEHWAGEDAFDAARGLEIQAAARRLSCDAVDADEQALRRRYRHRPDILRLLD